MFEGGAESFGVRSGSIRVHLGFVRDPFGFRSGPFGVRSGSVLGTFSVRSGQFRIQIFGATNLKFQKFSICAAVAAPAGAL